jgi:hypothetical protein
MTIFGKEVSRLRASGWPKPYAKYSICQQCSIEEEPAVTTIHCRLVTIRPAERPAADRPSTVDRLLIDRQLMHRLLISGY